VALDREFGNDPRTVSAEAFAAAVARSLGAPEAVANQPLKELPGYLQKSEPLLIFLDNGESALNENTLKWLGELAPRLRSVRWLISSRSDHGLQPLARSVEVKPMAVPQSTAGLSRNESYQLLKAHVELRSPRRDIDGDPAALLRVLRAADGFPLALDFFAARREGATISELAARLDHGLLNVQAKPRGQSRADHSRHDSLFDCVHWGVSALDPMEQGRYCRLGVFPFDFDHDAALAVAEATSADLESWQLSSLIVREEFLGLSRFRLLPVYREYALWRLAGHEDDAPGPTEAVLGAPPSSPDHLDAVRAFVRYYSRLAESTPELSNPAHDAVLDREWRSVLAASEYAAKQCDVQSLVNLADGFSTYLLQHGLVVPAEELNRRLLDLAHHNDRYGEARAEENLGLVAWLRGLTVEAQTHFSRGLRIFNEIGNKHSAGNCLNHLGDVALGDDDPPGARAYFQGGLALFEQVGGRVGISNCLTGLGEVALREDRPKEARASYQNSLSVAEAVGNRVGVGNCRLRLGDLSLVVLAAADLRAQFDRARPVFAAGLDFLGHVDPADVTLEPDASGSLREEAASHYERALEVFREAAQPWGEGEAHFRLALTAATPEERRARLRSARECWVRANMDRLVQALDDAFGDDFR